MDASPLWRAMRRALFAVGVGIGAWQTGASMPAAGLSEQSLRCSEVSAAGALYCSLRSSERLSTHAAAMLDQLRHGGIGRLVIDLREHRGAEASPAKSLLIEPLRALPGINRERHLFVIVGPGTSAAGREIAAHFQALTAALLIADTSVAPAGQATTPAPRDSRPPSCRARAPVPDVRIEHTVLEAAHGIDPAREYALYGPPGLY